MKMLYVVGLLLFRSVDCVEIPSIQLPDILSLAPDQVFNNLKRTVDVGGSISGLVTGGFEQLGYVPIAEAVQRCEGSARNNVMYLLMRLRREGEQLFQRISKDLEARCRGYVEYAARDCQGRIEGLVAELQNQGRAFLTSEQERCGEETNVLLEKTRAEEETRLRRLGEEEEVRLRRLYEKRAKEEEIRIRAEFVARGMKLNQTLTESFTKRGEETERQIRKEFELRGDLLKARKELEIRARGDEEMKKVRAEYEARGAELEVQLRAEFEERGKQARKDIEEEFNEKAAVLRRDGEKQCTDMIAQACVDVEEGTESDDFCLDFFFFSGSSEALVVANETAIADAVSLRTADLRKSKEEERIRKLKRQMLQQELRRL